MKSLRHLRYDLNMVLTFLMNLLPLVGVFAWGWQVAPLLFFFWLENVAIGIMTLIKLAMARGTAPATAEEDGMGFDYPENPGQALGTFIMIYGFFTTCHGLLLRQFFPLKGVPANEILISFAAILAFQVILFLVFFIGRGDFRRLSISKIFAWSFRRMVLLHVIVIAAGAGLEHIGSPLVGLLALTAGKAAFDWNEQLRHRRRQEYRAASSRQQ